MSVDYKVVQGLGPYPEKITCPYCNRAVKTKLDSYPGLAAYLGSCALILGW